MTRNFNENNQNPQGNINNENNVLSTNQEVRINQTQINQVPDRRAQENRDSTIEIPVNCFSCLGIGVGIYRAVFGQTPDSVVIHPSTATITVGTRGMDTENPNTLYV